VYKSQLLLQAERGLGPLQSGLTTFPQAIGVFVAAPVAGRIYSLLGPRRLMLLGLSLGATSTLFFLRARRLVQQVLERGTASGEFRPSLNGFAARGACRVGLSHRPRI